MTSRQNRHRPINTCIQGAVYKIFLLGREDHVFEARYVGKDTLEMWPVTETTPGLVDKLFIHGETNIERAWSVLSENFNVDHARSGITE